MIYSAGLDVSLRTVNLCLVDARGIAHLLRSGWYRPVHIKSMASH